MRFRVKALSILFLISLIPFQAYAQLSELSSSDQIRLTSTHYFLIPTIGTFQKTTVDSFFFTLHDKEIVIPIKNLIKLEKQIGSENNAWSGAIIGGISGGLLSGFIFYNMEKRAQGWNSVRQPGFAGGFVTGALVGGGVGAFIGSNSHTRSWKEILIND